MLQVDAHEVIAELGHLLGGHGAGLREPEADRAIAQPGADVADNGSPSETYLVSRYSSIPHLRPLFRSRGLHAAEGHCPDVTGPRHSRR